MLLESLLRSIADGVEDVEVVDGDFSVVLCVELIQLRTILVVVFEWVVQVVDQEERRGAFGKVLDGIFEICVHDSASFGQLRGGGVEIVVLVLGLDVLAVIEEHLLEFAV